MKCSCYIIYHNLPCHQQPSSNVAFVNANPSVEESNHIQELGNTVPFQTIPPHKIQLENNAPLAREGNEMQQVIEVLRDLQHKMQYVVYFLII